METRNLLDDIEMPMKKIVDIVNWFLDADRSIKCKYKTDNNKFRRMNDVGDFFGNDYSGIKKIDGIFKIIDFNDRLKVEGFYKAKSRAVSYDVPVGSNDEGWRIEKGDFTEDISVYVPKELFDKTQDEVFSLTQKFYTDKRSENIIKEEEYWLYNINEAEKMLSDLRKLKTKKHKDSEAKNTKPVLFERFVSDDTFATRLLSFIKEVNVNDPASYDEKNYLWRVAESLLNYQINTVTEDSEYEYLKRCHPNLELK